MDSLADIIKKKTPTADDVPHYISQEFQDYGYRLAMDLGDAKHKALYIKMAKEQDRYLLEKARQYVIDYPKAKSKGKLFMWALSKLKKGEPLGGEVSKQKPLPKKSTQVQNPLPIDTTPQQ